MKYNHPKMAKYRKEQTALQHNPKHVFQEARIDGLSEEFKLAVKIGLPNYFDFKNGKISKKVKR